MKISSPAGGLEILIKDASVEGDFVVLKAELGYGRLRSTLAPVIFGFLPRFVSVTLFYSFF